MKLAMTFEDAIFKDEKTSSLDIYHKKITKKLKKVQKHYSQQAAAAAAAGGGGGAGGATAAAVANESFAREKAKLLEIELRETYGAQLLYIMKHADEAVRLTKEKNGEERANVLKLHTDNAKQWLVQLGIPLLGSSNGSAPVRQPTRSMSSLTKLKGYLDSRVDNIRSHIVKCIDPDLFIQDTLGKMEGDFLDDSISGILQKVLKEWDRDAPECSAVQMKRVLDRMNAPVPIPRRNQEGDEVRAAVARIEKVRAVAQALCTYMGLPLEDKTEFRGCLSRCHAVAIECLNALDGEYSKILEELGDKDENGEQIILLEDAWNNPLQLKDDEENNEPISIEVASDEPDAKRQKTEEEISLNKDRTKRPLVIRSRLLLTPGRQTFATLIPQLKRKKATLVRHGALTFIKLDFGKAFEMTIYFVPLLVTIRAIAAEPVDGHLPTVSLTGGLRWPSCHQGLGPSLGSSSDAALSTPSRNADASTSNTNNLSVLGVSGPVVGHIVAKKLEYASSQATYVLRRCFAETTVCKLAKTDFEIEILETGALIRFLQIARMTYCPGWVDEDL